MSRKHPLVTSVVHTNQAAVKLTNSSSEQEAQSIQKCSICLEPYASQFTAKLIPCGHDCFCMMCISYLMFSTAPYHRNCPICRHSNISAEIDTGLAYASVVGARLPVILELVQGEAWAVWKAAEGLHLRIPLAEVIGTDRTGRKAFLG
ncbi:hypothetical protein FN846DRAFT_908136 [Sphaerosporella brunnea]|uniref:RING-type domain-containing protein n=1 Tax=Sphaerosporella brunnea TaxID=1250544 RepID=A0A5J5ETZ4_9PEZI|nr:hypothetical protein FN846DRAFT_908136 [Sphaerosporella brunnea]